MIGMIEIVGPNSVHAQKMSTVETNMTGETSMTNSTMGGKMTTDNLTTNSGSSDSIYNK